MNEILKEKKDELEKVKMYFLQDLKIFDINCIKIFGSSTIPKLYNPNSSDIDLIVHTSKIDRKNIEGMINFINHIGGNFVDKQPLYIEDFITPRIEYCLKINDTVFDINIFPNKIWGLEEIRTKVLHDWLDTYLGSMTKYAIPIYGENNEIKKMYDKLFPFYSDDIRQSRMEILENRILSIIKKIDNQIKEGDVDILENMLKSRAYFMKWLFILNKVYPLSVYKHLQFQLAEWLKISEEDINVLLFKNNVCLEDSAKLYINYVNDKIKEKRKMR